MSDLSVEAIRAALRGSWGRPFRYVEVAASTNDLAMRWAFEDAPEGSVVVTDHQTGGRGRWGRSWASQPGRLLQFSVVMRPDLPLSQAGLIATGVGVGVAAGIESCTPLTAMVKWPNDVLIGGKKVSGTLVETQAEGERVAVAIAGIGINVGWSAEEVPDEIKDRATSLAIEGAEVDRASLLASVLAELESRSRARPGELIAEATRRSAVIGRTVRVRYPDGRTQEGIADGYDASGSLVLRTREGAAIVQLGEVEQVRET